MIECPECGSNIRGTKCSCGYVVKGAKTSSGVKATGCAAYGCPIPGSIAATTHPGENTEWFCRFHFGEKVENFQKITQAIRSGAAIESEEKAKQAHKEYLQKQFFGKVIE